MPNSISKNIRFRGIKNKKIETNFKGGKITSDAGLILLRQAEQNINLIDNISKCIKDTRNKSYVKHDIVTMLKQRIFGIACGYEDVCDHQELRKDDMFKIASNKLPDSNFLASPSTICRFENNIDRETLVEISKELVEQFISSFKKAPKKLVLDFDTTDDRIHGKQEGRFFHGYYDSYCFLPLYVFCGDKLLVSYLRPSKIDGAKHSWAILKLLVTRFREQWPGVKIIFRADSGFCRYKMLEWCDRNKVEYVVGISTNNVLKSKSSNLVNKTKIEYEKDKTKVKNFGEFLYAAKTWRYEKRIIVKSEYLEKGENTRYVVTNMELNPDKLYKFYIQRGDMENRIKEQQLYLFADRTSCHYFLANQFRLLLASCAYILLDYIRKIALKGTALAKAQCSTIRLKLIKIGAIILENSKRVIIQMSECFVFKNIFQLAVKRLC